MADRHVHVNVAGGADYDSLNHALTDEATDLVSTLDGILTIYCEGTTADTTAASTGYGYTVDTAHYINIVGNYAKTSGSHYSDSYYRLDVSNSTALTVFEDYTRIEKLQVKSTASSGFSVHGIAFSSAMGSVGRSVVFANYTETAAGTAVMFYGGAGDTSYLHNSVIYGPGSGAGYGARQLDGGVCYIHNCTITAHSIGVRGATSDLSITNCAIFNNGDDINNTVGSITYSAGDDAEFDSGTGNVGLDNSSTTWNVNFKAYSTFDFHLISGSGLKDAGSDLGVPYNIDIDGTTRSGTWDIGADEYVAAGATATATSVVKVPATTATAHKTKRTTATSIVKAPSTTATGSKTKRTTATSIVKAPTSSGVGRKTKCSVTVSIVKAPTVVATGTVTTVGAFNGTATSIVKAPTSVAICHVYRSATGSSIVKAPTATATLRRGKRCTAASMVKAPTSVATAVVVTPGAFNAVVSSVVKAPNSYAIGRLTRSCTASSIVKAPSVRMTGTAGAASTQLDRIEQLIYILMAIKS